MTVHPNTVVRTALCAALWPFVLSVSPVQDGGLEGREYAVSALGTMVWVALYVAIVVVAA